jgi:hypothetical protein
MSVIVQRDNGCGTTVKGNNGYGWSSDDVTLWLGGGKIEIRLSGGESDHGWDYLFIAMNVGSRVVWGGWPAVVVWIQCFSFRSRGEATWWSVAGRWSGDVASSSWLNENKVWHDVTAWWYRPEERRHRGGEREETTPVGLTRILLERKMKKIHAVDSTIRNERWRFKTMVSLFNFLKTYVSDI